MIVADTNLIAYLVLPGSGTRSARRTYQRDPAWCVPLLWRSAFRSVLTVQVQAKRLDFADALEIMETAAALVHRREYSVDSAAVLRLADASPCSAYDLEYVALAMDLGVSLVTSDRAILKAFPRIAEPLSEFGSS